MATSVADAWREYFQNWPPELQRHGILVTSFGEQIPFTDFGYSSAMVVVERHAPDTLGARTVLVAYDHIAAVKIAEVVRLKTFQAAGFTIPPPAVRK